MAISAIVLTRNEEGNLGICLSGLAFCDEILVIDDFSTDKQSLAGSASKTLQIAKDFGAKIYQRRLDGDFAAQRNFGLAKAKYDWVLFVDADERVSDALKTEIESAIKKSGDDVAGFYLKRKDYLLGKALNHGEAGNVKLMRLATRNSGKWYRAVHETWQVKGAVGFLKSPLLHYPHRTISEFLDSINFYSTLHAKANLAEGKRASLFKIVLWPIAKFKINYLVKLGFLDGTRGFVLAMFMSLHSFLAWGKLWTKEAK